MTKDHARRQLKRLFDSAGSGGSGTSNGSAPKIRRYDDAHSSGAGAPTDTRCLQLSEQALADLREVFALFDRDGDGEIRPEDVGVMLRAIGQNPTQAELEMAIAEMDTNGNGTVDFTEYVAYMGEETLNPPTEEELRQVFEFFDKDRNGFITADELRLLMTALGEQLTDEEVHEMIREADMDGDGQINYHEFAAVMK
ncbi:hypothetical protein HPB52_018617 [Rhipicephalus sanguineus]|uniref:EF-hand domain-containing protein n=2 Tax=Rhipicephalus sanguineus TaxID=34632 RepID=A0A9D4T152_RHISA|nr:hypothetical protein HPB52_018617 [Rhipicephalus sanguineus]